MYAQTRSHVARENAVPLGSLRTLAIGLLFLLGSSLRAEDSPVLLTPECQAHCDRALQWLADNQLPDGSFSAIGQYRKNVGIAALGGLALLSSGSTPGRGPYGEAINKTTDYLVSRTAPSGYIVEEGAAYHGPMYGHGFATLFLAEVHGMTDRDDVRDALKRAVTLIIDSQNEQGGWRYTPGSDEADISVTSCQLMALRAARNAGLAVPKETIDKGIDYMTKCQNNDGGFRYRLFDSAESEFARSAAALATLFTSGVHEGPAIERARVYVLGQLPSGHGNREPNNYFYGHYYAVQCAWQAGGQDWERWYTAVREELLAQQLPEGSWADPWFGREYSTAMALIILQAPNHVLPIFER